MKILRKLIASSVVIASIMVLNSIGVSAEWRQDKNEWGVRWWYAEGNSYATGWREIDGNWYYFYPDNNKNLKGYMAIGYVGDYYLNGKGIWTHLDYSDDNIKFNEFLKRLNEIEKNEVVNPERKRGSTLDLTKYANEFNQQYDTLLKDVYNYLKEVMPENEFRKLENEEIQWTNEKEKAVNSSLEMYKGGSMTKFIGNCTSLDYNHDRIYELLKYINSSNYRSYLNSSVAGTDEITESEARELILKEDGEYINDRWLKDDHFKLVASKISSYDRSTLPKWNIPKEDYYQFSVVCYDDYGWGTNEGNYIVGKNSKNVYAMPNQACMSAYQVKDNQIIKAFKFIGEGGSYEWR